MNGVIRIVPARVMMRLGIAVAVLFAAGVAVDATRAVGTHDTVFGLLRLLDLDDEANVPSWFSSILLFLCASLLAAIGWTQRAAAASPSGSPAAGRWSRHWLVLAGVFTYMSMDEMAQIHELLTEPLHARLHTTGVLYFAWVIPVAVLLLVLLASYLRFLAALPRRWIVLFVAAGAIYVGGAMGMEMVSGYWLSAHGGHRDLAYALLTAGEEGMEMLGLLVFIYALLTYIRSHIGTVRVVVGDGDSMVTRS